MSDVPNEAVEPEVPAFEPPPPPEPVVEEAPGPAIDPEAWAAFAKSSGYEKFANDPSLVFKSYGELEKQFHSRQPEPEPQHEPDPADYLPPHIDPQKWDRAANWALQDPAGAAQWAMTYPNEVGPQHTQMLVNHWAANDPAGYMQFLVQQQYGGQQQQMSPGDVYAQQQTVKAAMDNGASQLPEFDRYKESIANVIDQREDYYNYLIDSGQTTLDEIVSSIYAEIRGKEWLTNLHATAQPQETQVDSRKKTATTITRSTAAASQAQSEEDRYAEMIANARGI